MSTTNRAAHVAALRLWADLLEDRDDIPLPYKADELTFYVHTNLDEALALHDLMARPRISRDSGAFPIVIDGTILGTKTHVAVHSRLALVGTSPVLPALVPALAALTAAVLPVSA